MLSRRALLGNLLKASAGLAVAPVLSRLELPEDADQEIVPARRYWPGFTVHETAGAPWQLDQGVSFDKLPGHSGVINGFVTGYNEPERLLLVQTNHLTASTSDITILAAREYSYEWGRLNIGSIKPRRELTAADFERIPGPSQSIDEWLRDPPAALGHLPASTRRDALGAPVRASGKRARRVARLRGAG